MFKDKTELLQACREFCEEYDMEETGIDEVLMADFISEWAVKFAEKGDVE